MTQNIYDDPAFFDAYATLPRSMGGLDAAPEWPRLRRLLPNLDACDVIDLGCGYGWFCAYAVGAGARAVTGFDVSEKMLARARSLNAHPAITYLASDLETLRLGRKSAGLVYSSLAFHYVENLDRLFSEIARALRPQGAFVFSVEHPMLTAPQVQGWMNSEDGRRSWPVNSYLEEGARTSNWLADSVLKQHRTFSTYLNMLVRHGLTLSHCEEWGPSDAELAAQPELADERQRPTFLLLAAQKPI
tara:strand:+ start:2289 stop:3023 length:735 start_codon:yes stop_codon:yes gene_type:complete